MFLFAAVLAWHTGHAQEPSATDSVHIVPMFPAASDPLGRQGFVRVINHSDAPAKVTIQAFDDTERDFAPSTLSLNARQTRHFNSNDLEMGNPGKRLTGGTGAGEGNWHLTLSSDRIIEVLSYVRTQDGFLTAMHDTVPLIDGTYRISTFNPGSNPDQMSMLRLINTGDDFAEVLITGTDDAGERSEGTVSVSVPPGASLTLPAEQLESGDGLEGALGDGTGKWRLSVNSSQSIIAMSLLASPTGHLTNLSTAPEAGGTVQTTVGTGTEVSVRVLYVMPADRLFREDYSRVVSKAIVNVQSWYRRQLDGLSSDIYSVIPEQCRLPQGEDYYSHGDVWSKVLTDVQSCAPVQHGSSEFVWTLYVDVSELEHCDEPHELGRGGDGLTMLPREDLDLLLASGTNVYCDIGEHYRTSESTIGGLAHELGHTFGLPHPPGCDEELPSCDNAALMASGYDSYPDTYLRDDDKAVLRQSPFFKRYLNPLLRN